jgi:hypothetical protein
MCDGFVLCLLYKPYMLSWTVCGEAGGNGRVAMRRISSRIVNFFRFL